MNADSAHIAVLIGGNDYRQFKYTRDLELENKIIDAACSFWDAVQSGIAPEPVNLSDMKYKFPSSVPDKSKKISPEISACLNDLSEVQRQIKELTFTQDAGKLNVMQYLEDSEYLLDENDSVLATWKTNKKGSRTFLLKGNDK